MKDYTVAVNELRNHYNELTVFKKSVRAQVKAEYEAKMDFEIQSRIEAEEIKFANHVAAVKERENLPVTVIQDHVLRTRTWNRWERIRDLAGIPGEFVRAEDAREAKRLANSPFQWSEDRLVLTVTKDSKGLPLSEAVIFDMTTNRKIGDKWWPESGTPEENGVSQAEREAKKQDAKFLLYVSEEIQRAIDAGTIDNPEQNG